MKALEPETQDVQDMILLLLWTGQRKRNVLSLRANEIDWDNRVWHIPAGKTKSSRLYSVALTSKAMEILQRRRGQCADIMFPPVHESASGHRENLNVAWYRVRERANLPQLRIHDLRHTNASWLALNGASAMVIKEALQHSSISTSQRYVHLATGDVREMMDRAQEAMAG
jgi:integrase